VENPAKLLLSDEENRGVVPEGPAYPLNCKWLKVSHVQRITSLPLPTAAAVTRQFLGKLTEMDADSPQGIMLQICSICYSKKLDHYAHYYSFYAPHCYDFCNSPAL